jgi:hypothetical protein
MELCERGCVNPTGTAIASMSAGEINSSCRCVVLTTSGIRAVGDQRCVQRIPLKGTSSGTLKAETLPYLEVITGLWTFQRTCMKTIPQTQQYSGSR